MNPIRAYRNWRMYTETVRELNKLNARQLSDLGINRADIETDRPQGHLMSSMVRSKNRTML